MPMHLSVKTIEKIKEWTEPVTWEKAIALFTILGGGREIEYAGLLDERIIQGAENQLSELKRILGEKCEEAARLMGYEIIEDDQPEINQEAKFDGGKPRPSLVPPALIRGVDAIREYGCKKYTNPDNWRRVEPQRYWEATLRHALTAWDDWKSVDEESGMPAIWHMACNLAFLMQFMEEENEKANQE